METYEDVTSEELRSSFTAEYAICYPEGGIRKAATAHILLLLDNTLAVVENRFPIKRLFKDPIGERSHRTIYRGTDAVAAIKAVDAAIAEWDEIYGPHGYGCWHRPSANEVIDEVGRYMLRREAAYAVGLTASAAA